MRAALFAVLTITACNHTELLLLRDGDGGGDTLTPAEPPPDFTRFVRFGAARGVFDSATNDVDAIEGFAIADNRVITLGYRAPEGSSQHLNGVVRSFDTRTWDMTTLDELDGGPEHQLIPQTIVRTDAGVILAAYWDVNRATTWPWVTRVSRDDGASWESLPAIASSKPSTFRIAHDGAIVGVGLEQAGGWFAVRSADGGATLSVLADRYRVDNPFNMRVLSDRIVGMGGTIDGGSLTQSWVTHASFDNGLTWEQANLYYTGINGGQALEAFEIDGVDGYFLSGYSGAGNGVRTLHISGGGTAPEVDAVATEPVGKMSLVRHPSGYTVLIFANSTRCFIRGTRDGVTWVDLVTDEDATSLRQVSSRDPIVDERGDVIISGVSAGGVMSRILRLPAIYE